MLFKLNRGTTGESRQITIPFLTPDRSLTLLAIICNFSTIQQCVPKTHIFSSLRVSDCETGNKDLKGSACLEEIHLSQFFRGL